MIGDEYDTDLEAYAAGISGVGAGSLTAGWNDSDLYGGYLGSGGDFASPPDAFSGYESAGEAAAKDPNSVWAQYAKQVPPSSNPLNPSPAAVQQQVAAQNAAQNPLGGILSGAGQLFNAGVSGVQGYIQSQQIAKYLAIGGIVLVAYFAFRRK